MEMSPAYMEEAASAFARHGFTLEKSEAVLGEVDGKPCRSTKYDLVRGEAERFVLEVVDHPTEGHRYYLEIAAFHGLRSFSFPLDSWKVKGSAVELKYYAMPENGLGLSLRFDLAASAPLAATPSP